MRCSFVQLGDVHLGHLQYDSPERLDDFGRAWLFACQHIALRRPDFAICTGDLFNRFAINPITYDQAVAGLNLLRDAGVPIVDIHGNHDRPRFGEPKSWIQTLADQGLLTYLDIPSAAGQIQLEPVQPGGHQGSYVDWAGCRVIGLRYVGASTDNVLEQLEASLAAGGPDRPFTILVLHAGVEGIVPNFNAEVTAARIERLRAVVDYVALGHIHKYYALGNFAYNGGSLETWSAGEWGWERGLIDVDIDTERQSPVSTSLIDIPRRPFHIIRVDVEPFSAPQQLHQHCWDRLQHLQRSAGGQRPVVIFRFRGRLRFAESDVRVSVIEDACRRLLDPLVVRIDSDYDLRDFVTEGSTDQDVDIDRGALERSILQGRIAQDARFASRANSLASIAGELKGQALRDEDGRTMLETLRAGIARIRDSERDTATSPVGSHVNEVTQ